MTLAFGTSMTTMVELAVRGDKDNYVDAEVNLHARSYLDSTYKASITIHHLTSTYTSQRYIISLQHILAPLTNLYLEHEYLFSFIKLESEKGSL